MAGAIIGLGVKKALKKISGKLKPKTKPISAAASASRASALKRMDATNKSGSTLASDIRRDILKFQDEAKAISSQGDKRILKRGAGATAVIGSGTAYAKRKRKKK